MSLLIILLRYKLVEYNNIFVGATDLGTGAEWLVVELIVESRRCQMNIEVAEGVHWLYASAGLIDRTKLTEG